MIETGFCTLKTYIASQLQTLWLRIIELTVKKRGTLRSSGLSGQPPCVVSLNRIPPGSWDSHMHVIDPIIYPLSNDAAYSPSAHTLEQAIFFESSVKISKIVLVQPSIYGNDNSCLLDALQTIGPERARGVISFNVESTPASQLREWHALGVRGVRINLQSVNKSMSHYELERMLRRYADAIRPLNWVLQLYIPLHAMIMVEAIAPRLHVRLCIDHFGHPLLSENSEYEKSLDPYMLSGFHSLINLLAEGNTFVKLSAPYRISKMENFHDLEPVATELLRVAGKSRIVFATDWPHTRFEGVDVNSWIEMVFDWCEGDPYLAERLFRGNAEELWA